MSFKAGWTVPLAAAILIAASGILHALQTDAWGREERLQASAQRLVKVPLQIKGWNGDSLEFDPRQLKVAQAAGAFSRTYTSTDGTTSLNVMMLTGPSGPIAVHPPTVCFTAAGYTQVTSQRRVNVSDASGRTLGSFWTADFEWRKENGLTNRIRTYWGWSNDGRWQAPEYPRYEFAGSRILHKLYVTRQLSEQSQEIAESEPIDSFLRDFVPAVNEVVFTAEI